MIIGAILTVVFGVFLVVYEPPVSDKVLYQRAIGELQHVEQAHTDKLIEVQREAKEEVGVEESLTDHYQKLFRVIFTYDDGKMYQARRGKATNLASEDVLNGGYFKDGLDVSGQSMIDNLKYKSGFIKASFFEDKIEGDKVYGYVTVETWAQKEQYEPGYTKDIYRVAYDKTLEKTVELAYEDTLEAKLYKDVEK